MTICTQCKHFLSRGKIWYQQFCGASPRELGRDPVTGKEGYVDTNDVVRRFITDQPYAYARDINIGGNCALFTPKHRA